jgi:calcineurin-like phosphoesterase family protein
MSRFFTSDHHFGHANILKYEDALRRNAYGGRFQTTDEMDTYLIDRWNATVGQNDEVFHLGDMSYKYAAIEGILPFLNGKITLIVGNHDPMFKQILGTREQQTKARYRAQEVGFVDVYQEHTIEIPGIGIVKMSHFPYSPPPDVPECDQRYLNLRPKPTGEALLLHGHVHSQWKYKQDAGLPPMINLGVEVWGMSPVSENEIINLFQKELWPNF